MAGEAGGNNLRARTRASSILMQADNMITAKTHGPFKHFLGLIALVPCKTCGPYDEMSTCVSPLAASCTSQTAAAHKPSLQRTACLTTHVLPAALLQQCCRIVPLGNRCTRKEAKPPQSTMKATVCCHGHVCHSHTKHARMFSARAPEASPKVEAPEGPPLAALAIRPPERRRLLSGSDERGLDCLLFSLAPRELQVCSPPKSLHLQPLRPDRGRPREPTKQPPGALPVFCFPRAPEASPKVEAPEGPPLAALAIRPPDPRRTATVVLRTSVLEHVHTGEVHMCRLPRELHVHACRGEVLVCRAKLFACGKPSALGAETTIIPGGCTVRATCALPRGRNLRGGPKSGESTENCPDFGCFNLIRLRPHSAKCQDKSFRSKLPSKNGRLVRTFVLTVFFLHEKVHFPR